MNDRHAEEHEAQRTGGVEPLEDDPVPAEVLDTPEAGLEPRPGSRKRVVVIGAGMAGEHCSLYHAWIQGALESGIRAAQEVHQAPASVPA